MGGSEWRSGGFSGDGPVGQVLAPCRRGASDAVRRWPGRRETVYPRTRWVGADEIGRRSMTWVHPRMRGAGLVDRDLRVGDEGSPPHTRGGPLYDVEAKASGAVHPRTRGVAYVRPLEGCPRFTLARAGQGRELGWLDFQLVRPRA